LRPVDRCDREFLTIATVLLAVVARPPQAIAHRNIEPHGLIHQLLLAFGGIKGYLLTVLALHR
jgi:hypothetical protein